MGESTDRIIDGRFRLVSRLGSGGMGTVWRARDLALDRDVALKEVRLTDAAPDDTDPSTGTQQRVQREAQALARLNHPNVVTIYHLISAVPHPWLVMELVDGPSLERMVKDRGRLSEREAAVIGQDVLHALQAAHQAGIHHRDVKPGNVLVRPDGRAVLTDFGIAALQDSSPLTTTGQIVGSPEFMAPERVRGEEDAPAADLWSLGLLMYVALEGRSPMRRSNPISTLTAVLHDEVPRPENAGNLLPVLRGLLQRDPAHRLTADEADALLSEVLSGSSATGTIARTELGRAALQTQQAPTPTSSRRRTTGGAAAAGGAVLGAASLGQAAQAAQAAGGSDYPTGSAIPQHGHSGSSYGGSAYGGPSFGGPSGRGVVPPQQNDGYGAPYASGAAGDGPPPFDASSGGHGGGSSPAAGGPTGGGRRGPAVLAGVIAAALLVGAVLVGAALNRDKDSDGSKEAAPSSSSSQGTGGGSASSSGESATSGSSESGTAGEQPAAPESTAAGGAPPADEGGAQPSDPATDAPQDGEPTDDSTSDAPESTPSETTTSEPAVTVPMGSPGSDTWIAQLASVPKSAGQEGLNKRYAAVSAHSPGAQVFDSGSYATHRSGYWVIWSGPFSTGDAAVGYCQSAGLGRNDCFGRYASQTDGRSLYCYNPGEKGCRVD